MGKQKAVGRMNYKALNREGAPAACGRDLVEGFSALLNSNCSFFPAKNYFVNFVNYN